MTRPGGPSLTCPFVGGWRPEGAGRANAGAHGCDHHRERPDRAARLECERVDTLHPCYALQPSTVALGRRAHRSAEPGCHFTHTCQPLNCIRRPLPRSSVIEHASPCIGLDSVTHRAPDQHTAPAAHVQRQAQPALHQNRVAARPAAPNGTPERQHTWSASANSMCTSQRRRATAAATASRQRRRQPVTAASTLTMGGSTASATTRSCPHARVRAVHVRRRLWPDPKSACGTACSLPTLSANHGFESVPSFLCSCRASCVASQR